MTDVSMTDRPNTGGYAPPKPPRIAPIYGWPPKPGAVTKYLFGWEGYLFPWQATFMAIAAILWWLLVPDLERAKTLSFDWIATLFTLNLAIIVAWTSFLYARLYITRKQGTTYKYNVRWPKDTSTFLFGSQLWDNVFWTVASAVPLWTAYLAGMLWLMANGWIPYLDIKQHPIYFGLVMLLLYFWQEVHFFTIHRLIHWSPLYKWVHSIHHKNSNPIPWSGLAMHPVEHLLYYSSVLLHFAIPSNPLILIYHLLGLNLGAVTGHSGFAKLVVKGDEREMEMDLSSYLHYLHHRYHEVNYGNDGAVPLDKWFGTWHDGTAQAHDMMMERFKKKAPPPAGV